MVAGLTAMAGCVSSTIQEVREARTSMDVDDYMVVLGKRDRPNSNETELNFISCISKNIASGSDALNVIDERAFMDSMFPWFEPRTAPVETGDLPRIMNQPLLAARLDEIGIKYLVWVEGSTERTDSEGSLTAIQDVAQGTGAITAHVRPGGGVLQLVQLAEELIYTYPIGADGLLGSSIDTEDIGGIARQGVWDPTGLNFYVTNESCRVREFPVQDGV